MKVIATSLLLFGLAASANAAVVWDESINGLLSTDPNAPTPIVFAVGSNVIKGSAGNVNAQARDYITFTVPAGHVMTAANLQVYTPENTGFCALNEGSTSVVPSNPTIGFWLAGTHLDPTFVGTDLFDAMSNASVTTESLPASELGPLTYTFVIQQTSPLITTYQIEWVLQGPVATEPTTWGSIKALYR